MIEIDDDKYPHQDIEDIKKGHWARYPMSFSYLLSSILSFYFCKPWICSCVKPVAFMICESGNSNSANKS